MTTTTDLSNFGFREIKMVSELLNAWVSNGLPDDFEADGVVPMMNMDSGNVFLTNSDFQVAMMNGDTLESFYSSPDVGLEGFFDELVSQFNDMTTDDREWLRGIAEARGDEDQLMYTVSTSSGRIEVTMSLEQAKAASHQGSCDDDVLALSTVPAIAEQLAKIDPLLLRAELREFGAWDELELMDDAQNLQRLLWTLAGDIVEGND